MNNNNQSRDILCKKTECEKCICITCMHQGFDCSCEKEHKGAIQSCQDYDEMVGEQLSLF